MAKKVTISTEDLRNAAPLPSTNGTPLVVGDVISFNGSRYDEEANPRRLISLDISVGKAEYAMPAGIAARMTNGEGKRALSAMAEDTTVDLSDVKFKVAEVHLRVDAAGRPMYPINAYNQGGLMIKQLQARSKDNNVAVMSREELLAGGFVPNYATQFKQLCDYKVELAK